MGGPGGSAMEGVREVLPGLDQIKALDLGPPSATWASVSPSTSWVVSPGDSAVIASPGMLQRDPLGQ